MLQTNRELRAISARFSHLVAPEVQIPVGKDGRQLVDEASDNGHQLRMGRIEGDAPMLELGDVGRARSDVAGVAESESCSVTRHVQLRNYPDSHSRRSAYNGL